MSMTRFVESGLNTLCRHLEIKILNLYYGSYDLCFKISYPHYRLVFVLESDGKSYFSDSEKEVPCLADRIYLLPPFCEVTHAANATMKHLSIHFSASVENSFVLTPPRNTFFFADDPESCSRLRRCLAAETELSRALFFYGFCVQALERIITPEHSRQLLEFLRIPEYAALLQFLNTGGTAAVTVEKMAEICHLSANAFIKRFTRDARMPPGRFLDRILTARAGELLTVHRRSVKETAALLEFSSAFSFSRFFRRQTGFSPKQFREKMK